MSWPADGKPRFKLTAIEGGGVQNEPIASPLRRPNTVQSNTPEWYVLDRADCHRICWSGGSFAEAERQWGKRNLIDELMP